VGGLVADPDVFRLSALEELIGPFERGVAALADRDAELALRVRRSERRERLASVCQFVAVLDRDAEGSVVEESARRCRFSGVGSAMRLKRPGPSPAAPERGCKAPGFPEQRVLWRERDYVEDGVDAVGVSFADGRLEVGVSVEDLVGAKLTEVVGVFR
jgi:hypothetical protein